MRLVPFIALLVVGAACSTQEKTSVQSARDTVQAAHVDAPPPQDSEPEYQADETIWEPMEAPKVIDHFAQGDSLMRWFRETGDTTLVVQASAAYQKYARMADLPSGYDYPLLQAWDDPARRNAVTPAVTTYTRRVIEYLRSEGFDPNKRYVNSFRLACSDVPFATFYMKAAADRDLVDRKLWYVHWADLRTQELECDNSGNSRIPSFYADAYGVYQAYAMESDKVRVAAEALEYHLTRYVDGYPPFSALFGEPDKWNPVALLEIKRWLPRTAPGKGKELIERWATVAEKEDIRAAARLRSLLGKPPQQA